MKNLHFNDVMKNSMLFFCAMALCGLSISCSDDDKDGGDNHHTYNVKTFDDLVYFQDIFVEVDSVGDFLYRSVGQPLPTFDADTTHLFVGVNNIDEALKYFNMSLAPDITRVSSVSHNYTYTLSDVNGEEQGTVSFAPGTETNHVAELTTNLPGLKHFRRVTFLDNRAWPLVANEGKYKLGDSREDEFYIDYWVDDARFVAHYTQKFICVREKSNGVKPLYVGITDDSAYGDDVRIPSQWCPATGNANLISGIIKSDFEFYKACFDAAGISIHEGWLYWFDDYEDYIVTFKRACICLDTGEIDYWDISWQNPEKHIVMKIDWEDD